MFISQASLSIPASTQTHAHRVGDAIQPSYPLSSPSPPVPNPSRIRCFPMSQFFTWGGQSFGVSASASVLPMNTQDWSPLGWTGWISLRVPWTLKSLLQQHSSKASIFRRSAFFTVQLSHRYMTTGKTVALTRWTFVDKVMSLLFNMLSRLVITFLPRSKCLSISWLQSPSAVILEPKKLKSDTVSTVSPSISHEVIEPDAMIIVFWILSFKPTFSLSSFTFIKGFLVPLHHGVTKSQIWLSDWIELMFIRNSIYIFWQIHWRRKWQPTPVFLPRKSHGQRNLAGSRPQGRKQLDMTNWLRTHTYTYY